MLRTRILRALMTLTIVGSALMVPACRSTSEAQPEMLTGSQQQQGAVHERHASGIESQAKD